MSSAMPQSSKGKSIGLSISVFVFSLFHVGVEEAPLQLSRYTSIRCVNGNEPEFMAYLPRARNNLSEVCKLKSSVWVLGRESWIVCLALVPWRHGWARAGEGLVLEWLNLRNEWLPRIVIGAASLIIYF